MFAQAREAAGVGSDRFDSSSGATVAEVIGAASSRYGTGFTELLPTCRVWLNGEPADGHEPVADGDEVAVLPPVSGG